MTNPRNPGRGQWLSASPTSALFLATTLCLLSGCQSFPGFSSRHDTFRGQSPEPSLFDGAADRRATRSGAFGEEFTEPENVTVSSNVVLITELYDASAEKKVWSVESSSFDRESIAQIVDGAAESIVNALRRDSLVGS